MGRRPCTANHVSKISRGGRPFPCRFSYPFMAMTTIEVYCGRLLRGVARVLLARESQSALEQCGVNTWDPTLSDGDDDWEGLQDAYEGISGGKAREPRRHKIYEDD